ncbi:MAG: signal peptidase I [Oscillospiraceae bacterium]|nr:signal peptidase I [Oscillospiraceae bacterium]
MKRVLTQESLTVEQLEHELQRERHKRSYRSTLLSTISALVIVAAVAVLVSMLALPVLQVVGESMTPLLHQGEIVIAPKGTAFQKGDVIAFYFNNKILVKRVIANAGEWVNIDADGNVFINDEPLEEPYISDKALGDCNISLPYQVPDGKIFVMGDHRSTSSDSRNTAVGCVAQEQIVGRVVLRVWPLNQFGVIK